MTPGVQFVFSFATYAQTPLVNRRVFLHGEIIHGKHRNGEMVIEVKDEKGIWEGFAEEKKGESFTEGQKVRAYGVILSQPDEKNTLSCQWIKTIETEEWEYCVRQTRKEWEVLLQTHPELETLKPFELPKPKIVKMNTQTVPKTTEPNEFISAAEIKVEREYL